MPMDDRHVLALEILSKHRVTMIGNERKETKPAAIRTESIDIESIMN